jgi:hypothetical protein
MLAFMVIIGLIVWVCFVRAAFSKNKRTKSSKGPELNKHVIVKHRGQLKHYRINKYGELYEK